MRKARKVLFTDINPHIDGLQKHPLFPACDEWQVQDVLADVPDSSYEMILVLPPWMVVKEGHRIAEDTFESGIFRPSTLYGKILADSGRVLMPGGRFRNLVTDSSAVLSFLHRVSCLGCRQI